MKLLQNSYWNNRGKFQSNVNSLNNIKPKQGFSDNPLMNCFVVMSNIYYDAYNNGWGGNNEMLERKLKQYVRPVLGVRFGNMKKFYNDSEYLERQTDNMIVKLIKDDSLVFDRITVINKRFKTISLSEYNFNGGEKASFKSYKEIVDFANTYQYKIEQI